MPKFGYLGTFPDTSISGSVSSGDIAPLSVVSGTMGSGAAWGRLGPSFVIASGTIGSLDLGSGIITNLYLGSGAVQSGAYASGSISQFKIASGSIFSGLIASGATQLFDALQTVEAVNAMQAICITSGNRLAQAMAGSGLRMPAIGIVTVSGASGDTLVYNSDGRYMHPGGGANWSGQAGKLLYVGSGGEIVAQGLLVSGQSWQRFGVAVSGGIIVQPSLTITSGGLSANGTTF